MTERLIDGGEYEIDDDWTVYIYIPQRGVQVILDLGNMEDTLRVAVWMHEGRGKEEIGMAPIDEAFLGLPIV